MSILYKKPIKAYWGEKIIKEKGKVVTDFLDQDAPDYIKPVGYTAATINAAVDGIGAAVGGFIPGGKHNMVSTGIPNYLKHIWSELTPDYKAVQEGTIGTTLGKGAEATINVLTTVGTGGIGTVVKAGGKAATKEALKQVGKKAVKNIAKYQVAGEVIDDVAEAGSPYLTDYLTDKAKQEAIDQAAAQGITWVNDDTYYYEGNGDYPAGYYNNTEYLGLELSPTTSVKQSEATATKQAGTTKKKLVKKATTSPVKKEVTKKPIKEEVTKKPVKEVQVASVIKKPKKKKVVKSILNNTRDRAQLDLIQSTQF